MGYTDRQQRRRERRRQLRQLAREAEQKAERLEDLLELVEREYEEEVSIDDELTQDGEQTETVTRTELTSPRIQHIEEVLGVDIDGSEAVNRGKISPSSKETIQDAYQQEDALELARHAIHILTGFDPKNDRIEETTD